MKPDYSLMLKQASKAAERAYVPYTSRGRGAVLAASDGTLFTGSSIEIASYAGSVCPEIAALSQAIAAGKRDFTAVAVYPSGWPCGLCRQALSEFGLGLEVVSPGENGAARVLSLRELLPKSFGKDQLADENGEASGLQISKK